MLSTIQLFQLNSRQLQTQEEEKGKNFEVP